MTNEQPTTVAEETTQNDETKPEAAAEAATEAAAPVESMESLMAGHEAYEESFKTLKPGQLLTGRVVRIDSEGVLVDVGYKTEGLIPVSQLSHRRDVNPEEIVSVGDTVDVSVTRVDEAEGTLLLSKKRADLESAWIRVLKAHEQNEILTATCTEQVKGGLIVDLGLRGFVPASHVDLRPVHDLSDYVGESLDLKVLEIDRGRRKVVLSRKNALADERSKMKERTLQDLEEGQIINGTVARLTNFGAFVNLGGVDGLVHISELAWKRIKHPSDVVRVGEKVDVRVLSVNHEKERISLSLKQARPDPWMTIAENLKVGDIVPGRVSKMAKNYVFVEIADGVEGLVPVNELSEYRVNKPQDLFKPDQEVQVKVLEVKADARRILLSIRQANPNAEPPREHHSHRGGDSSGFTIGDRLSAQLGHLLNQPQVAEEKEKEKEKEAPAPAPVAAAPAPTPEPEPAPAEKTENSEAEVSS